MRAYLTSLLLVLLPFANSYADEVFLKNGDRLTGDIVRADNDNLVLKTSFSGELTINRDAIKSLSSDGNVSIKLSDGSSFKATLAESSKGLVTLAANENLKSDPVFLSKIVAINPPAPVVPKTEINGRFNLGGSVETGNTEKSAFHLDTEMIARGIDNRITLGAGYNRSEDNDIESSNNSLAYVKYDHFISKKWYGFANALFTKDKFKDLKLRNAIGLGLGYQFWEDNLGNFSIEFGPSYVNEDFITAVDRDFTSGRWSVNYDRWIMDKQFQLFHLHEGLVSFEDTSDIFIRSRTGVRAPIFMGLTLTAEVDIDYDNLPSPGNEKTDTRYLVNAGYAW